MLKLRATSAIEMVCDKKWGFGRGALKCVKYKGVRHILWVWVPFVVIVGCGSGGGCVG